MAGILELAIVNYNSNVLRLRQEVMFIYTQNLSFEIIINSKIIIFLVVINLQCNLHHSYSEQF